MSKYLIIRKNTKHNIAGRDKYTWEQSNIVDAETPEDAAAKLNVERLDKYSDRPKHPVTTIYGYEPENSVITDIKKIE